MNKSKPRILLVEDDASLAFVTKDTLEGRGYNITLCRDGQEAFDVLKKENFDICLLDIMLPKIDGLALAERIREKDKQVPIIFISAKSLAEDKIAGFKIGADDYISKPYNMDELDFKLKVFIRRSGAGALNNEATQFRIGKFSFDFQNLTLILDGREELLTLREAEVLRMLCMNVNKLVQREQLLITIWGSDDYFLGRSLDVFISRLRKYLKDDPKVSIDNVHSVGFKLMVRT